MFHGTGGGPVCLSIDGEPSWTEQLAGLSAEAGAGGCAGGIGGVGWGTHIGASEGDLEGALLQGSLGLDSSMMVLSWLSRHIRMLVKDAESVFCMWLKRARMDGWTEESMKGVGGVVMTFGSSVGAGGSSNTTL